MEPEEAANDSQSADQSTTPEQNLSKEMPDKTFPMPYTQDGREFSFIIFNAPPKPKKDPSKE